MNLDNNEINNEYTVEALEARFEMEAVVDDGGADTDGSCECKVTW
tara:strand:- start:60 stop:194 length:135 start_codon:yes stop_codon:yes gene_type:complete